LLSFPLYYMDSVQAKDLMQYILEDVFGESPVFIAEEKQESAPVSVFPNPSQGSFLVRTNEDLPQYAVTIYDVTGRQVFSVTGLSGNENRISTSGLQQGIYFLKMTCGNQDFNVPLIIVK
jgi:hypothetical protein